jgi:hypothetical protein
MAVANDYEIVYNGLTIADGTAFALTRLRGFVDLPGLRSDTRPLLRRHGAVHVDEFLAARVLLMDVEIVAVDDAAFETAMAEFLAAFTIGGERTLEFQLPGVAGGLPAQVNARVTKRTTKMNTEYSNGVARGTVELECTDPRVYSGTEQTVTVLPPEPSTGRTYPRTYPITYPPPVEDGLITATNSGTIAAPCVLKFNGSVTNPTVTNFTTGESLTLNTAITTGGYMTVDTANRSVLLNGTTDRYYTLEPGSAFITLQPGANDFGFSAGAADPTATLEITFRDAFI